MRRGHELEGRGGEGVMGQQQHVLASQDDLVPACALEILVEVRPGEAPRKLLLNDLLANAALRRRQLAELGGERRAGCEDRGPVGHFVHNVHQRGGRGAVFLQQRRDGLARGGYIGGLQMTLGIPTRQFM